MQKTWTLVKRLPAATVPGRLLSVILVSLLACDEPLAPSEPTIIVDAVRVDVNPLSSLSASVTVRSTGGTLVRIEAASPGVPVVTTPECAVAGDSVVIPLLPLRPSTAYLVRAVLTGSGRSVVSAGVPLTTGPLPAELPPFELLTSVDPSPGFVMVGITSSLPSPRCYAVILDNASNVVWYRGFDAAVADFQKLPNGRFSVFTSPDGAAPRFLELDLLGTVVNEYAATAPLETGAHELRVAGDQRFLFGAELRSMDLSSFGGASQASVRGIVVEGSVAGVPSFRWSTFDHFLVEDAAPDIVLTGPSVNPWHGNAIEIDGDDHLLVSFRNMDEITKIDRTTGAIVWRMGGKRNQFRFIADGLNGFSHQHGVRRLRNGHIMLFDNGNLHSPPVSRAVEYEVDETEKTATLVWEFRGSPDLYSLALGFAQRLPDEHTLVCFGISRHIVEVDMAGQRRWEVLLDKQDYYPYRAFRIPSIY